MKMWGWMGPKIGNTCGLGDDFIKIVLVHSCLSETLSPRVAIERCTLINAPSKSGKQEPEAHATAPSRDKKEYLRANDDEEEEQRQGTENSFST